MAKARIWSVTLNGTIRKEDVKQIEAFEMWIFIHSFIHIEH